MELSKSLSVIRYAGGFGLVAFIVVADLLLSPGTARAQHPGDYWLFSTLDGGGMLTSQQPVMRETTVFESLCIGGFCLYSNTDPGFLDTGENLPGLFVLSPGTTVSLEVVAIDSAASVKFGNRILDAPGESAVLGTVPGLHVHPSWQVQLPEGSMGDFPVEFRFVTDSPAYADSTTFTVVLTNEVASTTSTSTTTTTTSVTTTLPPPLCGALPLGGCKGSLAGKSKLRIKLKAAEPSKDKMRFRYSKGAATIETEFGDPLGSSPQYSLCIWDSSASPQPLLHAQIAPGGLCDGKPCWKRNVGKSLQYKNKAGNADGIQQVKIKADGSPDKAQIQVKAKGLSFAAPTLPLTPMVTAQFIVDDGGVACWEVPISTTIKNDALQFKGKGP